MILTNVGSHGIILIRADRFREFCHAIQEEAVITELSSQEKVIGVKQSRKAIREGRAKQVYLACDADPAIVDPVAESCAVAGIPVEQSHTMAQLGQACRITVGAAVVAVL
jgi:large subunit ribosomal protein L7A